MTTGFFWARVNPPHAGHMWVIKKALLQVDRLIVVIGSAERKYEKDNPFSGAERKRMLEAYLKEEGIDMKRVRIFALPDPKMPFGKGVRHVMDSVPKFDVIFMTHELKEQRTGLKMELEKAIEEEAKSRKKRIIRFRRTGPISSTRIRESIAKNRKWEHMTGKSVASIIRKLGGIERIRKLHKEP
ncbi:MAG: adenylyltransferase/cytidyltransferase family protein [Candidatus Aenigmatarchaeota archaeon]